MNRFRKRSQAKRKADQEKQELDKAGPPRLNALPTGDFRTSLILPHLTKRFTLLRSEDGSLVSLDTMESHLAVQRETGRLTALEANAVLNQYKVQRQAELPHVTVSSSLPPNRALQTFRRSPSTVAEEELSLRASLASNSTFDHEPPSTGSSFGATSSSLPFPYATELASPIASGSDPHSPASPPLYKRGGNNSMFGGRVPSFATLNMSKSPSANSLRSASSRRARSKGLDDEEEKAADELGGVAALPAAQDADVIEVLKEVSQEPTSGPEMEASDSGGESFGSASGAFEDAHDGLGAPELSARQLHRISRVLDDIEVELSKSYLRVPVEVEDEDELEELTESTTESIACSQTSSKGSMNDTEDIDPFFHRLSPSPSVLLSSQMTPTLLQSGRSTPDATPYLPALASQASRPLSPSSSPPQRSPPSSSTPTPVPFESHSRGSPSTSTLNASSSPPKTSVQLLRAPSNTSESSEDVSFPGAYRFPASESTRRKNEAAEVVDGKEVIADPELEAEATQDSPTIPEPPSGPFKPSQLLSTSTVTPSPTSTSPPRSRTISTSTATSLGSSFHGEPSDKATDDDLDEFLYRSEAAHSQLSTLEEIDPSDISDPALHLPPSELIKDLQLAPLGVAELALEDLVMIQETLVRTASKRAARRAAGELSGSSRSTSGETRREVMEGEEGRRSEEGAGELKQEGGAEAGGSANILRESMLGLQRTEEVAGPRIIVDLSDEQEELEESPLPPPEDEMANADVPARVPRLMPLRNPTVTTSVLIRDVRTQADLATHALKAPSPQVSPQVVRRRKSIRNIAISAPQFVSGPSDIPALPIPNPVLSANSYQSGTLNRSRSSLGLRFKMLLKKANRDDLPVPNGHEILPFDLAALSASMASNGTSPTTPLSQTSSSFTTTASREERAERGYRPERPQRSTSEGTTSLLLPEQHSSSGASSPLSATHSSTFASAQNSGLDRSASPLTSTNENRSLNRVISRFKGHGSESNSTPFDSETSSNSNSNSTSASTSIPTLRRGAPSRSSASDGESALGAALNSRAPISYDIGSMRRRRDLENLEIPQTAPLDIQQRSRSPTSPELGPFGTAPLNFNAPLSAPPETTTEPIARMAGHSSVDSMARLRDVAQDLGLPPRKANELAALSYNRQPPPRDTSSIDSHSDMGDTVDSFASGPDTSLTLSSISPAPIPSSLPHEGDTSSASIVSPNRHRRSRTGSVSTTSRSIHDRPSTPPPTSTHRRKVSLQEHARAGPVPTLPNGVVVQSPAGTNRVISTVDEGSMPSSPALRPPLSPGHQTLMSRSSSGSVYAESVFNLYMETNEEALIRTGLASVSVADGAVEGNDGVEMEEVEGEGSRSGSTQVGSTEGIKEGETKEPDDDLVWRVVGDLLRRNRTSSLLSDAFSHSRQTSIDSLLTPPSPSLSSDPYPSITTPLSSAQAPFSFLRKDPTLRENDADESGGSTPRVPSTAQSARYPSVYGRDEKRLEKLAMEANGIASEEEGKFLVRPRLVEDERGR